MMEKIDFSNLDWYSLLPRLGIDPALIANPKKHGPCPIEGDGKTRFRFDNKDGRGTWICNHCGAGDGVQLVALVNGTDNKGAVRLIRETISGESNRNEYRRKNAVVSSVKTPQEIEKARQSLKRAWEKSKTIEDTPAIMYLKSRVNSLHPKWLAPSFRFHASMFHFDEGTANKSYLPCLLSRVVDASNPSQVVTIHRTYITEKGQKAKVTPDQVKKLMPATVEKVRGESIKLNTSSSSIVIVTEGVENGLAWVMACKNRYSVYAAINCNNMANFKWPQGTKMLLIAGDHDSVNPKTGLRPGLHNALLLKDRAIRSGIKAVVKIPAVQDVDWDDLWNMGDYDAFRLQNIRKPQQTPEVA